MRAAVTSAGVERVEKLSEGEQRLWLITPLLEQQTRLNTIKFYVTFSFHGNDREVYI